VNMGRRAQEIFVPSATRASAARRVARAAYVRALQYSGRLKSVKENLRERGDIVVLTFHRVLDDASLHVANSLPGIVVREKTFRDLLQYIVREFEVVDLETATPGAPGTKPKLALTFDDGWSDNYHVAFPIIREIHVPVTIFLCSGIMDVGAPCWPEQVIATLRTLWPGSQPGAFDSAIEYLKSVSTREREQLIGELEKSVDASEALYCAAQADRTMSWERVLEMRNAGISFGSHTRTHQLLTQVTGRELQDEIQQSRTELERVLDRPCQLFAYPNGNVSSEARQSLADAGYTRAVSTQTGIWSSASDSLVMPRCNVCESGLVGPRGNFSAEAFEYSTIWKASRAACRPHAQEWREVESGSPLNLQAPTTV
jgi:peptidoglycan/xylan/chitin deacetylase (PgdA/CDA1 family)